MLCTVQGACLRSSLSGMTPWLVVSVIVTVPSLGVSAGSSGMPGSFGGFSCAFSV